MNASAVSWTRDVVVIVDDAETSKIPPSSAVPTVTVIDPVAEAATAAARAADPDDTTIVLDAISGEMLASVALVNVIVIAEEPTIAQVRIKMTVFCVRLMDVSP
jgi:hypothetical protein